MINSTLIHEADTWQESFEFWRDVINPAMNAKGFRTAVSMIKNDETGKFESWVGHKIHTTYEPFSLD